MTATRGKDGDAPNALHRGFEVFFALAGHVLPGLRLKQLAELTGDTPPTVYRVLLALAAEGLVERAPEDKDYWRLTPRALQPLIKHDAALAAAEQRLGDTRQRYSRAAT